MNERVKGERENLSEGNNQASVQDLAIRIFNRPVIIIAKACKSMCLVSVFYIAATNDTLQLERWPQHIVKQMKRNYKAVYTAWILFSFKYNRTTQMCTII